MRETPVPLDALIVTTSARLGSKSVEATTRLVARAPVGRGSRVELGRAAGRGGRQMGPSGARLAVEVERPAGAHRAPLLPMPITSGASGRR